MPLPPPKEAPTHRTEAPTEAPEAPTEAPETPTEAPTEAPDTPETPTQEPETPTVSPTPEVPPPSSQRMVIVAGGTYTVGVDTVLELDEFWIDQYEVSNAQYAAFLEETGQQQPPDDWLEQDIPNQLADHPVEGITWDVANAYCEWANKRLPSEAEWEVAARGWPSWLYPWGNDKNAVELPNSGTYPVGSILANRSFFGAFDMAGNVWEWVDEPYLPVEAAERVLHGGANDFQNDMTYRVVGDPNSNALFRTAGMRCASTQVKVEDDASVLLRDDFSDINSGLEQARAPINDYFYGYHPPDFYHMQISVANQCLSVYRDIELDYFMAQAEIFIADTGSEEGDFRYGLAFRGVEQDFYAFVISARTKSWQVLKSTRNGLALMAEGNNDTIRGDTQETRDRLFVIANGPQFAFFINGELVSRLSDSDYSTGKIGFIVENFDEPYTHIHNDALLVRQIPRNASELAAPPPATTNYPINSPLCQGTVFASDTISKFITHTILDGETLGQIAEQYGLTVEDILAANGKNIDNPNVIKIGQTVIIPLQE